MAKHIQRRHNNETCEPTFDDPKLGNVLSRSDCKAHGVPAWIPCFVIRNEGGDDYRGVCHKRAVRAGYNGHIFPSSLNLTRKASR